MKPIIKRMSCIVKDVMTGFQSDFEKYDKPYIEDADESKFPMIWIVGKSYTYLLKLGEYRDSFFNHERVRYEHVQGCDTFSCYLECLRNSDHIYLLANDDIREVNERQAREIFRDVVTPVVCEWKEKNGELPKRCKVKVKFRNITIGKLKQLVHDREEHGDTSLIGALKRFHRYRQVSSNHHIEVSYNPGYNEFIFCEFVGDKQGLVGGIIFHGWQDTGYLQNGSVQIDPHYGWSVHT